jgi:hypothetical protein
MLLGPEQDLFDIAFRKRRNNEARHDLTARLAIFQDLRSSPARRANEFGKLRFAFDRGSLAAVNCSKTFLSHRSQGSQLFVLARLVFEQRKACSKDLASTCVPAGGYKLTHELLVMRGEIDSMD